MATNGSGGPAFAPDSPRVAAQFPLSRAGLAAIAGQQFGGSRNTWQEYGYLQRELYFSDYWWRYQRQDIARRIVNMPAEDTWHAAPTITDDEDPQAESAFEQAWNEIVQARQLWNVYEKADRLAGIGRYAVILLGLRGQNELEAPARAVNGPDDLIFLKPFTEASAPITGFVSEPRDPRFGEPEIYELDLAGDIHGMHGGGHGGALQKPARKVRVHHSRIIHIAENTLEDDVFGAPRLQHVYNLLMDLEKVVGASAEIFYRAAWGGKQFDIDPEAQLDPKDEKDMADELDEFQHKLRRYVRTRGVTVHDLTGQTGDPRPPFLVIQDLIAAATGIPQRILFGSERGQLASDQDTTSWRARIQERQKKTAEPWVRRFGDRAVTLGVLPRPQGRRYKVNWPPITGQTRLERAREVALLARADRDRASAGLKPPFSAPELREITGLKRDLPEGEQEMPPQRAPTSGDRDVDQGAGSADANA